MTHESEVFFCHLRRVLQLTPDEFGDLFGFSRLPPAVAVLTGCCGPSAFCWGSLLWGADAAVNLCSANRIIADRAEVFFFHLRRFLSLTPDEFGDLFAFAQHLQDSCEKWLWAVIGWSPRLTVELLVKTQFVSQLPAETSHMVRSQQPETPNEAIQLAVQHLNSRCVCTLLYRRS